MRICAGLLGAVHTTVRYKLLVLALLPILLALPVTLVLALHWGERFGYDQLFIKVSTDLSVAQDVFERTQQDYLDALARLAESHRFHTSLIRDDDRDLARQVARVRRARGFSFLHLVDRQGRLTTRYGVGSRSRPSALLERALLGEPSVGIEIFSAADLAAENEALPGRVRLPLVSTAHALPTGRTLEERAMVIRALYPVRDANDNVRGVLDGGVILNRNIQVVDTIRDLVYGPGSLPRDSIGTVTLFLDDVRISTNVPRARGERALGTRVSREVREQVLDWGEPWIDRAFVVNDWYISAYQPILDVAGRRVGMLYAGFLELPFRRDLHQALIILVGLFLFLALVTVLLALAGAKSIFKPLESMSAVVGATRAGEERRIGPVASQDEIGTLAREFDAMLDLLGKRNLQIREAADSLELKVQSRTAELSRRNAQLEQTIQLLRETRRQLVEAEKLAALGEFTAGMAHEINNPMAVILGNLDVLTQELGEAIAPVQGEIDFMVEQVYRVRDIIDNLLQYARPSDPADLQEPLDLNELVQDSLKLVGHLIRKGQIQIRLDLCATRRLRMGRQDLRQVLVNLLVNATHAIGGGPGTVWIETRDWDDQGGRISVRDDGPGIDPKILDKIFTPFFSTKEVGQGTGLGLSLSYALVRHYGGSLTVQSRPGEGAEFCVWLPQEPQAGADDIALAAQLRWSATGGSGRKDTGSCGVEVDLLHERGL